MDYHSLFLLLDVAIDAGKLGNVERVAMYSGSDNQAFQIVLRDRKTSRIRICELQKTGVIIDGALTLRPEAVRHLS